MVVLALTTFQSLEVINFHLMRKIIINTILTTLLFSTAYTLNSCSKKVVSLTEGNESLLRLTYIKIPTVYDLTLGEDLIIEGKGFLETDIISFIPKDLQGNTIDLPIKEILDTKISVSYSELFKDGKYEVLIKRNTLSQLLGKTTINYVFNANIPDVQNMTIKGVVYSQGKGIANVVVSDGEVFAKTNAEGIYYLPSSKKNGYVFISVPSNYEVKVERTIPQFYKNLTNISSQAEIKDFELMPVNNENHVVAFFADTHLANRNDDLKQFQEGFIKDINETYQSYKVQNKKFYAFSLGDQSWDAYWYDTNFKLKEYLAQLKDIEFPIYNTIGNHDYDPYVGSNDWLAAANYRSIMGPTYYSINIGKVHYVVLDNVIYTNAGGTIGAIGDREYNNLIEQEQIDWLKKDLEFVTDKNTPIVIAMHVPLYVNPASNGKYYTQNGEELVNVLKEFKNVKIMTGHSHINYRVNKPETNHITEYNIGAVSATWWWTGRSGYANNHICKDGSPGGYSIWEMNNTNQESVYKSINFEKSYQFRSYDLNTVHITAAVHTPNANATYKDKIATYAGEYASKKSANQVLLNIWGYTNKWKILVTEGGKPLTIQQTTKKDPLHIISYSMQRLNVNSDPTSSFVTNNTSHLFLVNASTPTSTLEITVEDEYGNKYQETMIRPKAFSTSIK